MLIALIVACACGAQDYEPQPVDAWKDAKAGAFVKFKRTAKGEADGWTQITMKEPGANGPILELSASNAKQPSQALGRAGVAGVFDVPADCAKATKDKAETVAVGAKKIEGTRWLVKGVNPGYGPNAGGRSVSGEIAVVTSADVPGGLLKLEGTRTIDSFAGEKSWKVSWTLKGRLSSLSEKVTIKDKEYECALFEVEAVSSRAEDPKITHQLWMHNDLPGRVAKRVVVRETSKGKTTQEWVVDDFGPGK